MTVPHVFERENLRNYEIYPFIGGTSDTVFNSGGLTVRYIPELISFEVANGKSFEFASGTTLVTSGLATNYIDTRAGVEADTVNATYFNAESVTSMIPLANVTEIIPIGSTPTVTCSSVTTVLLFNPDATFTVETSSGTYACVNGGGITESTQAVSIDAGVITVTGGPNATVGISSVPRAKVTSLTEYQFSVQGYEIRGGTFTQTNASGVPIGLGSCLFWL